MFEKLKKRWNIQSNFQVVVILIVFAITGTSTMFIKKAIFELIGISAETHLIIKIPLYIVVILTVYNVLLLIIGAMFGQYRFFLEFERRFFSRFLPIRKRKKIGNMNTKNAS